MMCSEIEFINIAGLSPCVPVVGFLMCSPGVLLLALKRPSLVLGNSGEMSVVLVV